jgi:sugar lactone lactonase YvrE
MDDGGLFLTDTDAGSIYRLRSPADTLELFLQPDPNRLSTANGITSTPDGRTLYVAFVEGIARVDVATREIAFVPSPDSVSTAAIDGLYWHRGSLVAVQGAPTMQRVVRYVLGDDGRRIEHSSVLERGLPVVQQPTTGTIVGSRFYYIANSQYGRLRDTGPLEPLTGAPIRSAVRVIELRW